MRFHPGSRLSILTFALLLVAAAQPAVARLTVMHGFVDYASALVWIQAEHDGPVTVAWKARDGTARQVTHDARAADDRVLQVRLTDLAPGADVAYEIAGDGDRRTGTLRTQPYWRKPADARDITIAIGSCFFLSDPDPPWRSTYGSGFEIFDAIAARRPDLMVWMGVNLYFQAADELDPQSMASRYRRQRSSRGCATRCCTRGRR